MKYYLLLLILCAMMLGSCKQEKKSAKRYFLVGYSAMDDYGETNGNLFYKLDTIPTSEKLKEDIYQMLYCERFYDKEDIVIISFSEFKDSIECIKFKDSPESPLRFCDTNPIHKQ